MMSPEQLALALHDVWRRHLPGTLDQVEQLAAAARAMELGALDDSMRRRALGVTHELIGVSGTFGRRDVTDLARAAEQLLLLGDHEASDGALLGDLARRLVDAVSRD